MRWKIALVILYTIAAIACAAAEEREKVIHVGAVGFTLAPSIIAREILTEAYSRAGYRADYLEFPPNRMIASLKSGEIDAMLIAEASFSATSPDSIRIETPIWVDDLVAFTKGPLPIQGWESMRKYRIGYIAAMLIIERRLASGYVTFPVNDPKQLFRMLESGRTDVVVTSRVLGELTMRDLGITDISRTHGVLETVCNYHFLAKGKENVARHLSAELAEMEKSGRIAEITRETLARLFPGTDGKD